MGAQWKAKGKAQAADARGKLMTSYNRALNAIPREAVQSAEGLVRVVTYLDAARAPA